MKDLYYLGKVLSLSWDTAVTGEFDNNTYGLYWDGVYELLWICITREQACSTILSIYLSLSVGNCARTLLQAQKFFQ